MTGVGLGPLGPAGVVVLDGVRGKPKVEVDAIARTIVALSWLAHDLGDRLEELRANPIICGPAGCEALDALVIRDARSFGPSAFVKASVSGFHARGVPLESDAGGAFRPR